MSLCVAWFAPGGQRQWSVRSTIKDKIATPMPTASTRSSRWLRSSTATITVTATVPTIWPIAPGSVLGRSRSFHTDVPTMAISVGSRSVSDHRSPVCSTAQVRRAR